MALVDLLISIIDEGRFVKNHLVTAMNSAATFPMHLTARPAARSRLLLDAVQSVLHEVGSTIKRLCMKAPNVNERCV